MESTRETIVTDIAERMTVTPEPPSGSIYYQDTSNFLIVNATFTVRDYSVRSFVGQAILSGSADGQCFFTINVAQLPTGSYLVALIGFRDEWYEMLFLKK